MRNRVWIVLAVCVCCGLVVADCLAQPPQRGPGRRGGGPGGPGGPAGFMRMIPVLAALDADQDGEISASEIDNAVAALRTLDKNNDGKLTAEEIRPQFAGRRPGGPGGPDGFRGQRGGPEGREGRRGPDATRTFVERLISFDKNDDGQLTKDELPEPMQRMFVRGDTNKDGFLSEDEITEISKRIGDRRGRRGGQRSRPDRPQRPEEEL